MTEEKENKVAEEAEQPKEENPKKADEPVDEDAPKMMSKTEFWVRFGIFIALAVIAPFTYLAIAYGLFNVKTEESVSMSGWGILGLIVAGVIVVGILRQIIKGLTYGNMFRQCVEGYALLVPLVVFIIILDSVKGNIEKLEMFLIFLAICEGIAIPVNPIRKWAEQNNIQLAENLLMKGIRRALGKKE